MLHGQASNPPPHCKSEEGDFLTLVDSPRSVTADQTEAVQAWGPIIRQQLCVLDGRNIYPFRGQALPQLVTFCGQQVAIPLKNPQSLLDDRACRPAVPNGLCGSSTSSPSASHSLHDQVPTALSNSRASLCQLAHFKWNSLSHFILISGILTLLRRPSHS